MPPTQFQHDIREAVRDGVARTLGAVGLCGVALIHLLDLPGKFGEIPYMAWMYVGLVVASVFLAGRCFGQATGESGSAPPRCRRRSSWAMP